MFLLLNPIKIIYGGDKLENSSKDIVISTLRV